VEIKSLLIANRGEIVVRICQTAKKMGIKTYGIKTAKEPSAYYLNFIDEVIDFSEDVEEIPEFLDVDRLIAAAKKHQVEAIHPGYGFLAESPYFAQRCEEEKILFIGPSADMIYKMGNKTIAKQLARKHNVPLPSGKSGNGKHCPRSTRNSKAD
jgi:acetyl/propionyl-CoA carboxylase alpha subunit